MESNEMFFKNPYGGWLRFFRIINMLYWVMGLFSIIVCIYLVLFVGVEKKQELINSMAIMIELIPGTVMSFLIWRIVLIKNDETPKKIKWLITFELALQLMFGAVLYLAYKQGYISDQPTPVLLSVIYYFIWASYFKRSKRVFSYYGSNHLPC